MSIGGGERGEGPPFPRHARGLRRNMVFQVERLRLRGVLELVKILVEPGWARWRTKWHLKLYRKKQGKRLNPWHSGRGRAGFG